MSAVKVTASRVVFGADHNILVAAPPDGTASGTNSSVFIDADNHIHITSRRTDGRISYTFDGRHPFASVWAVAERHLP